MLKSALSLAALAAMSFGQTEPGKAPYHILYVDLGGELFAPGHVSANMPTKVCNGVIDTSGLGCKEVLGKTGGGGVTAGVRPIRYLQGDMAVDFLGNVDGLATRSSTFQCVSGCTGTTIYKIGTTNALLTTGASLVLPLRHERFLLSGGGGYTWLVSNEHANSGGTQATCYTCRSGRGSGPMARAEFMYMLDRHFGIGLKVRREQLTTPGMTSDGKFSNDYLGTRYKDGFFLVGGFISIRFDKLRD